MQIITKESTAIRSLFKAIIMESQINGIVFGPCELTVSKDTAKVMLESCKSTALVICEVNRHGGEFSIMKRTSPYDKSKMMLYISNRPQSRQIENDLPFKYVHELQEAVNLSVVTNTPVVTALKKDLPKLGSLNIKNQQFLTASEKSKCCFRSFHKNLDCYNKYYALMTGESLSAMLLKAVSAE